MTWIKDLANIVKDKFNVEANGSGVMSSKGSEVWLFVEDLLLPRDLDSGPQDSFSQPLGLIC